MSTNEIRVFFYGLFMDESLLASKGICPTKRTVGYVDGFALLTLATSMGLPNRYLEHIGKAIVKQK